MRSLEHGESTQRIRRHRHTLCAEKALMHNQIIIDSYRISSLPIFRLYEYLAMLISRADRTTTPQISAAKPQLPPNMLRTYQHTRSGDSLQMALLRHQNLWTGNTP